MKKVLFSSLVTLWMGLFLSWSVLAADDVYRTTSTNVINGS